MKKEIIAIVILIIVPIAAYINLRYVDKVTDELISEIDEAKGLMVSGNSSEAEKLISESLEKWLSKEQYAELYLRHDEVGDVTTSFYHLLEGVQSKNAPPAMFEAVQENLSGLAQIEHPRMSSIF